LRADERVPDDPRFADVHLDEPHKDVVAAFDAGGRDAVDRRVRFRLVAGPELAALEALVSLTTRHVVSVQKVEGVCPTILPEESWLAGEAVRADPRWQAGRRARARGPRPLRRR